MVALPESESRWLLAIVHVELLDDEGARVFGIDAYLGAPELIGVS